MSPAAEKVAIRVIEWPATGSAARFPMGGWWVVEDRPGRGYFPVAGPFRTEAEATAAAEGQVQP